ncbi:MAG: histidinol-phosphatase HisJ family protein [Actinobacteria bacterium]|nr:histidinol-phosphatase HisJ family protein [Actinomycetota bacterium]
MLTDYHLHLRPDDESATFDRFMTAENVARYRQAATAAGVTELGVSEHIHRFTDCLRVWDHPFWKINALDDLAAYCDFVRSTDLRLGIEMDWVPGRADLVAELIDEHEWDYVIGSVHFLERAALDWEDYDVWRENRTPEQIWTEYFATLADSARSGLFDVIAHPDLVKYWGARRPLPDGDLRRFYEPAVQAFVDAGVAVEISTAGLRKPVGEIYPAPVFLKMCAEAGLPFALSSDAHEPGHVGYAYADTVELMRELGINEICVFEGRRRRLEPLG